MAAATATRRRQGNQRRAHSVTETGGAIVQHGAGRRRLAPEVRREQILTEAIAFFVEHGVGGTTRELSARIGVSQPLLYKYFPYKRDLLEAVYDKVFLGRMKPQWTKAIIDRRTPLRTRMATFYLDYAATILTRDWVRLFVFAGLHGEDLNQRYLERLAKTVITPLRNEIRHEVQLRRMGTASPPSMNDMWALHGGIFYFGVREHIYGLGPHRDRDRVIERAVRRFLADCGL